MFDFSSLTTNLEGSSITNVIVIALVSFALSTMIAVTYHKTNKEFVTPKYFIQALILISIPVSMVMQAIGDSLARGLGMLGALAIIRFRTTLRNPRNITFMFASLAIGIASGVYGIIIAVVGTICFCAVVFLIYYSKLSDKDNLLAIVRFNIPLNSDLDHSILSEAEGILQQSCRKYQLLEYNKSAGRNNKKQKATTRFDYEIIIEERSKGKSIVDQLAAISTVKNVRINFSGDEKY